MLKSLLFFVTIFYTLTGPPTVSGADLLSEDQAFKFSIQMQSLNRIRASWEIAEGYYMYRDKLAFDFSGHGIITGPAEIPNGVLKQDSLFGEVEVLTENFSMEIPISTNGATEFSLIARGQGCNEPIGVCYPPMSKRIKFSAETDEPPLSDTIGQSVQPVQSSALSDDLADNLADNVSSADDLRSLLAAGFEQREFLPVDEAFKLRVETEENSLKAVFQIANGYYLYKDKIKINSTVENAIVDVSLPAGEIKEDEYFGEVTVFNNDFSALIDLNSSVESIRELMINANYQGCAVDGICYSPVNVTYDLSGLNPISVADASSRSTSSFSTEIALGDPYTPENPDDVLSTDGLEENATGGIGMNSLDGSDAGNAFHLFFGAFIGGILLTFTPCVLPMIPILSSVIAGQGKKLTKTKGGILATVYVLGTVVTYAAMGALAGATGDQLQAYFQNIWAVGTLSALFFIMALAMFGLYEIQMPAFIQSKLHARSSNMGGSIPLVFILGLVSALVVGACVSPVLISVLGIAVTRGDAILGAQLTTAMAIGMGLPLILLGFGAGHFIPRAGKWMEKVKQVFGVMLIGIAIYLLGLLPQVPVLLLWGSFFIILSIFLGATQQMPKRVKKWVIFEKGVGIVILIWGIFLIAGGLLGQRNVFKPIPINVLSSVTGNVGSSIQNVSHQFTRVNNIQELERQLDFARKQLKPVMIDYYADWCVDCIHMEKTTFQDSRIKSLLEEKYISIQIDVTDPTDSDNKALKQRFGVFGPPATLFIDRDGKPLDQQSFYGYMGNEKFLSLLLEM